MAPDLLMQAQLTYLPQCSSFFANCCSGWFFWQARRSIVLQAFVDFSLEMSQLAILRDVEMQTLYLDFYRELRLLLIFS